MARLPQPGSDNGQWGEILNDYLTQVHDGDGSLKSGTVGTTNVIDESITEGKLSSIVQAKLNAGGNGPITTNDLIDATVTGKAVITAVDGAAARSVIGAGTSNLAIGTSSTTAKAGDYQPTADQVTETSTNKVLTAAERAKLSGIATAATANATDAQLRDRSTHTGTQAAGTITGLSTVATSGSYNDLSNKPTIPTVPVTSVNTQTGAVVLGADDISDTSATHKFTTAADISKLAGVQAGAEVNNISGVNATDLTDGGSSTLHYHTSDRDRANHTGTQTASTISDFYTAVDGRVVSGVVAERSVTTAITNKDLTSGTNTFPTLNQDTTGSAAKLTTARTLQTNLASTSTASFDGTANAAPGVTGTLAVGNGGTGATTLTGLVKGNGTGAFTAATAGTDYVTPTGTETLTNKRVNPRVSTVASSDTPTINTDNVSVYGITALALDIISFTTNLSGTPVDGQRLLIYIVGTATRALAWGASFEAGAAALPVTTVGTTRLDVGFIWNAATSKWRCIAAG
ncbi:MAG: hypothetical protein WAQ27_00910 [Candidatus Microsaccharimonas sp.]